jgi:hypothetical protein
LFVNFRQKISGLSRNSKRKFIIKCCGGKSCLKNIKQERSPNKTRTPFHTIMKSSKHEETSARVGQGATAVFLSNPTEARTKEVNTENADEPGIGNEQTTTKNEAITSSLETEETVTRSTSSIVTTSAPTTKSGKNDFFTSQPEPDTEGTGTTVKLVADSAYTTSQFEKSSSNSVATSTPTTKFSKGPTAATREPKVRFHLSTPSIQFQSNSS